MPQYGRKGGGGRAFGAPRKPKETINDKVAKQLGGRKRAPKAEQLSIEGAAPTPQADPNATEQAVTAALEAPMKSESVTGNIFDFSAVERSKIQVVIDAFDAKLKSARKNAIEVGASIVELDTFRSRCAIIRDRVTNTKRGDHVTLEHPLRVTLGTALSLHGRWLKKEAKKFDDKLMEKNDLTTDAERTRWIANKINEQLVLYIAAEEED